MADTYTSVYNFVQPEPGSSDNTWGDKLNANWAALDTLLSTTFVNAQPPVGTILMFDSASALPTGWAVCDGTNGTPDLRDRFIVGSSATKARGTIGGADAITSVPAHTHTYSATTSSNGDHNHTAWTDSQGAHAHSPSAGGSFLVTGGPVFQNGWDPGGIFTYTSSTGSTNTTGAHGHNVGIGNGGAHTHTISGTTASTGDASVSIIPKYYAVIYIRRMS